MHGLGLGLRPTSCVLFGGASWPTITLDAAIIAEDANVGDLVGNLAVADGSGSYAFSITADPDGKFQLDAGDDSQLEVGGAPDYETATSHLVTIEADNGVDAPITRQFTISVTNVVETAPSQFGAGDWSVADLGTNGDIEITIAALPDPGDGPITDLEYQVDGGSWVSLGDVVSGAYPLSGFTDGTEVNLAVRAVNAAGAGTASATKAVTPTGVPDVFEVGDWSIADAESGGQLDVIISSLPAANGSAITDIEYRVDGGSWVSSGGTSSFSITGLTDDVEVDVELQAVNANGDSGAGDLKSETPTTAGGATISLQSGLGFAGSVYQSTSAGQWTADGSNIAGETGSTYTMEIEHEGKRISQVGAVNGHELWEPSDITGWETSFDAAYMDVRRNLTESGGAVSQWDDVYGNYSFVQGTGSKQPAYSATSFNGGPGLTFDGSDDQLVDANFTGIPTALSWVGLVHLVSGGGQVVLCGVNNGSGHFRWRFRNSGTLLEVMAKATALCSETSGDYDNDSLVGISWAEGGAYDIRELGVSLGTGSSGSGIAGADNGMAIGGDDGWLDGELASHVFVASALSTADIEKLEGLISHANGHAALLDAGHTYKSTPPTVEAL